VLFSSVFVAVGALGSLCDLLVCVQLLALQYNISQLVVHYPREQNSKPYLLVSSVPRRRSLTSANTLGCPSCAQDRLSAGTTCAAVPSLGTQISADSLRVAQFCL
jgi:hypothetical protein